jgi:hypothetical protein
MGQPIRIKVSGFVKSVVARMLVKMKLRVFPENPRATVGFSV